MILSHNTCHLWNKRYKIQRQIPKDTITWNQKDGDWPVFMLLTHIRLLKQRQNLCSAPTACACLCTIKCSTLLRKYCAAAEGWCTFVVWDWTISVDWTALWENILKQISACKKTSYLVKNMSETTPESVESTLSFCRRTRCWRWKVSQIFTTFFAAEHYVGLCMRNTMEKELNSPWNSDRKRMSVHRSILEKVHHDVMSRTCTNKCPKR
jgi:hypothetical protein